VDTTTYINTLTPVWMPGINTPADIFNVKKAGDKTNEVKANETYIADLKKYYSPHKPKNLLPGLMMTKAQSERYDEIWEPMMHYVAQIMNESATGSYNLDSQWDNYVAELKKRGMTQLEAVFQQMYDNYKKR